MLTQWPKYVTLLWLLMLPGASAGTPSTSPGEGGNSAILKGDVRLAQPVTLAHQRQPFREVLADLQSQTQVKLTASRDVADDRVTVFLAACPAQEALTLLAQHFDFQWSRRRDGYELGQDLASQQREAGQRAGAQDAQLRALLQRMDQLTRLAEAPQEQLEAQQRLLESELARTDLDLDARRRLMEERQAITDLRRPGGQVCAAVWRSLTPADLQQLQAGGAIRRATTSGTLPTAAKDRLHRDGAEHFNRAVAPLAGESRDPDETAEQAHVRIRLMDEMPRGTAVSRRGDRRLRLLFDTVTTRGAHAYPSQWSPIIDGRANAVTEVATKSSDPALMRPIELTRVRLKELAGARTVTTGPARFARTQVLVPLEGLVKALHQLSGLEFVADSFIRARLDAAQIATPEGKPKPVVRVLDQVASALEYEWSKQGNVIRLRSRTYSFDRAEEVPARVLKPWLKEAARGALAPAEDLDAAARIATALNDRQCRGLRDFWEWYAEDLPSPDQGAAHFVYQHRYALRFWSSLHAAQRQSMLEGAPIPLRALSATQREAFVRTLATSGDDRVWWEMPERRSIPTPADLVLGTSSANLEKLQGASPKGGAKTGFPRYQVELWYHTADRKRLWLDTLVRW